MMIFTIGHSDHDRPTLVGLLARAGVDRVVDVRSLPWSRRWPQFRRNELASLLNEAAIAYRWLGDRLGGRPRDPGLWRAGRPDYGRIAATPAFRSGLDEVEALAREHRVALLCAERDPLACHRAHLLAPALQERGHRVRHILPDGGIVDHGEPAQPAQPDLFG